jgi:hypothetical protein
MRKSILFCTIFFMISCKPTQLSTVNLMEQAPLIIYKTSADYNNKVPITLNEAGDKVLSFPGPSDLFTNGVLALPVKLKKGYLLDQRGIHPNSAFTSYTYEEYGALEAVPSTAELLDKVIDSDPFLEMYDCGKWSEFQDSLKNINKIITQDFKGCKDLMISDQMP